MKIITLLALALIAIVSGCKSKIESPQVVAENAAEKASEDGIFKYTIRTDVSNIPEDDEWNNSEMNNSDEIEILVAMNSVGGQYPVKYDLDCEGDGDFEYKGLTKDQKCIYKRNSGRHQIWVRGEIPAMFLCAQRTFDDECGPDVPESNRSIQCDAPLRNDQSGKAVVSIDSWGNVPWKSMHLFAAGCEALATLPKGSPDLRQVKDMSGMFYQAKSFNQPLEMWNVSNVTNMRWMFAGAKSFNQPLAKWNVTNVTNMSWMFSDADLFNQPLEAWNVSNVTDMSWMFINTKVFNQPLEKWNVSSVTNMRGMFEGTRMFNQPLEKWDVSNVTNMGDVFMNTEAFNQPLEAWNVSNVTNMRRMFHGTQSLNQPLEKWDVSNATNMSEMFRDAKSFNQPLEKWNVSNATNMRRMFYDAEAFSHYPKSWVVPKNDIGNMFTGTKVEAEAKKSPLKTK